jgi:hypothetical protein
LPTWSRQAWREASGLCRAVLAVVADHQTTGNVAPGADNAALYRGRSGVTVLPTGTTGSKQRKAFAPAPRPALDPVLSGRRVVAELDVASVAGGPQLIDDLEEALAIPYVVDVQSCADSDGQWTCRLD